MWSIPRYKFTCKSVQLLQGATLHFHTKLPAVEGPFTADSRIKAPNRYGGPTQRIYPLTPNDHYSGRTAPLTSKRCTLYIYSTNIGTVYFKHGIYSPSFSLQSAVCFIILTYLVPLLFTFYKQGVLKLKEIIPAPKG